MKRKIIQKIKKIIHWYDLPYNKVIILNSEFQKKIMKEYHTFRYGLKKKISKKLQISGSHLNLLTKGKSNFSVSSLKKIGKLFNISFNEIEKNIITLGRKE